MIAGILGAAAAILMLGRLAGLMFGRTAGVCAALLLMSNPILWKAGMVDQVRVYLAVITTGVALALWPEWRKPVHHKRFVWACLTLGVLAGFRPETLVSLTPLLVVAGIRARLSVRLWAAGTVALCVGVAPWLAALIVSMHGIHSFLTVMQNYAHEQAGGSSIVLGAHLAGVLKMFTSALWWFSLGVVAWIPALLFLPWRKARGGTDAPGGPGGQAAFLLACFLPLFLFSIAVHIAAAGHALVFLPVLCLAGGWALAQLGTIGNGTLTVACTALALALNVHFFYKPYSDNTAEASYKMVRFVSRLVDTTIDQIGFASTNSTTYLIEYDGWVTWRILEYYYPSIPVLHLPGHGAGPSESAWLIMKKRLASTFGPAQEIALPSCATLLWLVTDNQVRHDLLAVPGAEDKRYFIMTPPEPGASFRLGRNRLKTSTGPCAAR